MVGLYPNVNSIEYCHLRNISLFFIWISFPIGPKHLTDIMVVAPCSGNTMSKLANDIIDTPATMAIKSHLRNNLPVVIAASTNNALSR